MNSIFMDSTEKAEAVLGEKYLNDFLEYGISRRGFCVVTDRRLYCSGTCYHKSGGAYTADVCRLVIDIRDIVCTGMCMGRLAGILVLEMVLGTAWFLLIVLGMAMVNLAGYARFAFRDVAVVGILFLMSVLAAGILYYHRKRVEVFVIKYAGGEVAFLASVYASNETDTFERKIHEVKNKISA